MDLSGKTAVVTGACGGIGRAIVAVLRAAGARVALVDREGQALLEQALALGDGAAPFAIDLADPDAVAAGTGEILARFGRVDILVNNAGILSPHKLEATTLAEWRALMAVNLDAALLLTQAFVPAMKAAGWGRLVNIASYAWKSGGLTAGTGYAVSKAALVGLTFSSARELAGTGITANAVAPAYVVSPMILEQLTQEQRDRQLKAIPVGRFCEPEEVAHAVAFLSSPLAGFITGEVIDMNGGMEFG
ncbi:3-oxoacyl-ACP reductase [Aureimonas endophytica]|uniref:3-oxoacyl-ACP reductase n=1 Tax=Aureimonas endophytica TaxID=2027858 RepID=A0A917E8K8_9HYPH|nr:SDR family NAD(P)-dependent oxidoreductase [Aureimonas endophytica]GGE11396.1 3-oxoacyl-ACP reductase [Aureimonas endophytica]